MNENALVEELQESGYVTVEQVARWRDAARLLAAFDAIGSEGAIAVVKVDGERTDGWRYTVVVSGGRLGAVFFRKDGPDLNALLREAISFYRAHMWSVRGD